MLRKGKVIFTGRTQELLGRQNSITLIKPEYQVDLNRLVEITKGLGYEIRIENGSIQIPVNAEFGAILNRAAFEAGITLMSISTQQPTLEETFFEMTEEN